MGYMGILLQYTHRHVPYIIQIYYSSFHFLFRYPYITPKKIPKAIFHLLQRALKVMQQNSNTSSPRPSARNLSFWAFKLGLMRLWIWGLGLRIFSLRFRIFGLGPRILGLVLRIWGLVLRIWGLGFRSLGFRVRLGFKSSRLTSMHSAVLGFRACLTVQKTNTVVRLLMKDFGCKGPTCSVTWARLRLFWGLVSRSIFIEDQWLVHLL